MDVVYPLKRQENNTELRFSLRSLCKNLPHGKVWLSGFRPSWSTNIRFIRGTRNPTKYTDARSNIVRACEHPDLSDDFVLMNDDFFILTMTRQVPEYHRGELGEFIEKFPFHGRYSAILQSTYELLRAEGIENPLMYDIHSPTVMNKHGVLDLVKRFEGRTFAIRTMYHNIHGTPATYRPDVKKFDVSQKIAEQDFLSTSDRYAQTPQFKQFIRSRFPYLCQYELL